MTPIALVVARAKNGVIGNRGAIPWRLGEDLRRFKQLTLGKPVVMGRKTWDSLPKKPLPGRTNIVVTRDRSFAAEGAVVVHDMGEALARAGGESASEIAVIGGAEIYAAALPLANRIHLTEVDAEFEGDAVLPPFDPAAWRETAREARQTPEGLAYAFVTLERR
jgi:dihydrofolate reductase